MNHFIFLRRIVKDTEQPVATWVNADSINTISASLSGSGTRITMRDSGFLLVADTVSEVLDKIKEANHDR